MIFFFFFGGGGGFVLHFKKRKMCVSVDFFSLRGYEERFSLVMAHFIKIQNIFFAIKVIVFFYFDR